MSLRHFVRSIVRSVLPKSGSARRKRWPRLGSQVPVLEHRLLLAAVTDSGDTLNIDLQQDEFLSVSTDGSVYTFSSNLSAVDGGVADAAVFSGFGSQTFTLGDLSAYSTVSITDSASGTAVRFEDSGGFMYQHDFSVTLVGDGARDQPVGFRGASAFGDHMLDVITDRSIHLFDGSSLTTHNGSITLTAVNTGDENGTLRGVVMVNASITTTGSGNIVVDGTATNQGADLDFHFGISMQGGSTISSTSAAADAGTISLRGTQVTGNQFNAGVGISDASHVTSVSGDIQVIGIGGAGAGEGNRGVHFAGASTITSTGTDQHAAKIFIDGRGGTAGTDRNDGVLFQASEVRTVAGNVQIVGTGGNGTGFSNNGIAFVDSMITSTGAGDSGGTIELVGTAGNGTDFNRGVFLRGATFSSTDGNILINGIGGNPTGGSNRAIEINNGTVIESSGTTSDAATITIDGRATSGVSFNNGISLNGMTLTSVAGDISITGVGADASGSSNTAIGLTEVAITSTGVGNMAAAIAIQATAVSGTSFSGGLDITRTSIRSVDGDISLIGRGGNTTGDSNRAVRIGEVSLIESTGTGLNAAKITIDGVASGGTGYNDGVIIQQFSDVQSVDGDITITGVAGDNSDSHISGVALIDARIMSSGVGNEAATITVNGTVGVGLDRSIGVYGRRTTISSFDGDIEITGVGNGTGNDNRGIDIHDNSIIESTGATESAAQIRLVGNGGAGTGYNHGVFLRESRVSTIVGGVDIQGTGGHGTGNSNYGVSIHENSIVESTGNAPSTALVFVQGIGGDAVDWNVGVTVASGATIRSVSSDISLNGHGGNGSGNNNRGINMVDFGAIESTGVGSDAAKVFITGNGGGGVGHNLGVFTLGDAAVVQSVDGDIQLKGQAFLLTSGGSNGGVWMGTDLVSTGTAKLTVIGTGEARTETGGNHGITIGSSGTEIRSANGDISLRGDGGGAGVVETGNSGVRLLPGTSIVSTDTAAISLTGHGGAADSHGVWLREADGSAPAAVIRSEGSGQVEITGTGTGDDLRLDSDAVIDGTVAAGNVKINADKVHVSSKANLGEQSGTEFVSGFVAFSGVVNPGGSDGVTTLANEAILIEDTTLVIDTHGASASVSQFNDSIQAAGAVTIRPQVTLRVRWSPTWQATPNDVLTIVKRTGGTGTFAGLPEGATLADFFNATISYVGGDGDDITLTLPSSIRTTRTIVLEPGSIGTTIFGSDPNDNIGQSVHSAGDVNNDGYDDFLIGSSKADSVDNQRDNAGELYLIYGGPNLPGQIDLQNLGTAGVVIYGADTGDQTGHFVAAADINNDGFSDIIAGAHSADAGGNSIANSGGAYIIWGSDNLPSTIDLATLGSAGVTILGVNVGDLAGNAVGAIGDINNDGFPDIAMGAIYGDGPSNDRSDAGEVQVVFGGNDLPEFIDLASDDSRSMTIFGATAGDELGVGIRPLGDINGDNVDDVIITSWKADGTGEATTNAGQSYILYGSSSFGADLDLAVAGTADVTIIGIDHEDRSGWGVSRGGDVNGDGINDFLIGASQADGPHNDQPYRGESYLIFGSRSLPATIDLGSANSGAITIYGADEGDYSGRTVDIVGDLNVDGFADIVIGARAADGIDGTLRSAGETSIVLGRSTWSATLDLAVPGVAAVTLYGSDADDDSGFMVRSAGDVDGDLLPDLIIGARLADSLNNGRQNAGQVHVVTNSDLFHPNTKPTILGPLQSSAENSPTLSWSKVNDAVSYELWLGLIGGDSNPVISLMTSETAVPSDSLVMGRYRMWVRGIRQDSTKTDWAIGTFAVTPATTIHDLPFNGYDTTPTISWNAVPGSDGYRVYISNTTTGESGLIDTVVTDTSFTTTTDFSFGRHRIWVTPIGAGGFEGTWSPPRDFNIGPQQVAPIGATLQTQPQFSWTTISGAATYQIYVVGPGGVLVNESGLTGTTFTPTTTLPNGDFRWWIRGYTADGTSGAWSEPSAFSTGGRTNITTPMTFVADSIPEFSWAAVPNAKSYEVYVSRFGTAGALYRAAGLTSTSFQSSPLNNGDYRVWIRTTLADGSRVWGKGVAFTVNESVTDITTTITQPTGSSFDRNPRFVWQQGNGADAYDLYVLNDNANLQAAERVILVEDIQFTDHTLQNLAAGDWTWWVRTRNVNGVPGPWGNPGRFNNSGRVETFTTGSGGNGELIISWVPVSGAERYVLQVDSLTTGQSKLIREDNLTETFFQGNSALPAGTYRAWVRAIGSDGTVGPWSRQVDFTAS